MGLKYLELDRETRLLMLQEMERDLQAGRLNLSNHLSPRGRIDFPELLRTSIQDPDGSDASLARALAAHRRMNTFEPRRANSRKLGLSPIASDAHEVLAEYEFNRLYMRALCRRALAAGETHVLIYRARTAVSQRGSSSHLEQRLLPAEVLLDDLRRNSGKETESGLGKPRSGLSIRLPVSVIEASAAPEVERETVPA